MAVHVNMNGFHRLITHTYIKCNAFILKLAPLSLYLVKQRFRKIYLLSDVMFISSAAN